MMILTGFIWPVLGQMILHGQVTSHKVACHSGTFLDQQTGVCTRCTECDDYSIVRRQCTRHSDTQCLPCAQDDRALQRPECWRCPPCPRGTYMVSPCTRRRGPVCRKCPQGSYNAKRSYSKYCVPCTSCRGQDKQELAECTSTTDTFCGHCQRGYYAEFGSEKCVKCRSCIGIHQRVVEKCHQDRMGRKKCGRAMKYVYFHSATQLLSDTRIEHDDIHDLRHSGEYQIRGPVLTTESVFGKRQMLYTNSTKTNNTNHLLKVPIILIVVIVLVAGIISVRRLCPLHTSRPLAMKKLMDTPVETPRKGSLNEDSLVPSFTSSKCSPSILNHQTPYIGVMEPKTLIIDGNSPCGIFI